MQGRKDRVEPARPAGIASLIEARLAPILPTPNGRRQIEIASNKGERA